MVWAYGTDAAAAEQAAETLYQRVLALEPQWSPDFLEPAEAVRRAQALAAGASRPVVIADTQDNPGAGGDANTTGMLRALVEADAQNAALGLFYDPEVVGQAVAAGVGARLRLRLGGQSGVAGDGPFEGEFTVETLSPGRLRFDGPMMNGMDVDLGAVATLRIGGVRVVVSATKTQMLDRNLFRVGGVQPEEMSILVVKSSVHFRADFQPIAHEVLVAKAPAPCRPTPPTCLGRVCVPASASSRWAAPSPAERHAPAPARSRTRAHDVRPLPPPASCRGAVCFQGPALRVRL